MKNKADYFYNLIFLFQIFKTAPIDDTEKNTNLCMYRYLGEYI